MDYLNFTSRATYLAMREVWKIDFAAQIKAVRTAKVEFKNAQRAYSNSSGSKEWTAVSQTRGAIHTENAKVQDLLSARWRMKAEAQVQYTKEHAAK